MKLNRILPLLLLGLTVLAQSCKDKCDGPECYDVPDAYSFENVNYSGQTTRLQMMEEMLDYMSTANTSGTTVDAQVSLNMYANENSPFTNASLNSSGKDMKSKTYSADVANIEGWIQEHATASQSGTAGGPGVAGVVVSSSDPTRSYLLNEKGWDLAEVVEKSLMGALLYYQITSVYLSEDKIGDAVDNENVTDGEGTDMEHHWDEAFGYFGAPYDFPTSTDNLYFIGKYCNGRDAVLGMNQPIMDAYILGRTAISNDDMDTKKAQVIVITASLERVFAGTAIHYLNSAKANFADDAKRCHALSECYGFVRSLKFNADRSVSDAEIDAVLSLLGDDFYNVTVADITATADELASLFNLTAEKDQL